MKFKHQGKEYDMPVRKFKDQKSADKFSKALDKKKMSSSDKAYNKERKYLESRGISREAFKGGQVS